MIEEVFPEELFARMEAGEPVHLIDVRTPEEFEAARVPGARLVPLSVLPLEEERLPQDGPIYFLCRSGARSWQAARWLKERRPWQRCVNVAGGILAWAEAGLPVETSEEAVR